MNGEDKFDYNYSAPTENERREIESIKKQYVPVTPKEDKLTKLRRLNRQVNTPPKIFAYCFGVAALLIFGFGMALTLQWQLYIWGSVVGAVGAALMCATYPIYRTIINRNRKKYGQDIIELSNDLLNEDK